MFSNFKNSFKNSVNDEVPKEIITALSNELPDDLEYKKVDKGFFAIHSKEGETTSMNFRVKVPDEFKVSSTEELMEILYRSQTTLKVQKNEPIYINGNEVSATSIFINPLSPAPQDTTLYIKPKEFKDAVEYEISGNGYNKKLLMKRQPLADLKKMKFSSVSPSAIHVSFILDEENLTTSFTINYNMTEISSLEELIRDLSIMLALCEGTSVFLNMPMPKLKLDELDLDSLKINLEYLKNIRKLEEALQISFEFNPSMNIDEEINLAKLYISLVERRAFKEYIKFEKFSISLQHEVGEDELKQQNDLFFVFMSKENFDILGVKLELFSVQGFFDFQIKDTMPSSENEQETILLIDDKEGTRMYVSSRYFQNEDEAKNYIERTKELHEAKEFELI